MSLARGRENGSAHDRQLEEGTRRAEDSAGAGRGAAGGTHRLGPGTAGGGTPRHGQAFTSDSGSRTCRD